MIRYFYVDEIEYRYVPGSVTSRPMFELFDPEHHDGAAIIRASEPTTEEELDHWVALGTWPRARR